MSVPEEGLEPGAVWGSMFQKRGSRAWGLTRSSTLAVGDTQSESREFTTRLSNVERVGRCGRGSLAGVWTAGRGRPCPAVREAAGTRVGSPRGQHTGLEPLWKLEG